MTERKHPKLPRLFPASQLVEYLGGSCNQVAEIVGIKGSSVARWLSEGRLWSSVEADRWAAKARAHPVEIWGAWWWEAAALEETEDATLVDYGLPGHEVRVDEPSDRTCAAA